MDPVFTLLISAIVVWSGPSPRQCHLAMADGIGEAVIGSWAARCRKVPGTLVLTATRLIHLANAAGTNDAGTGQTAIDLTGVKFELTKKRPGFDQALVRLSNLSEHLGGRLVIEFIDIDIIDDQTKDQQGQTSVTSQKSNQKWSNLREFSELMQGLQAKEGKEAKDREAEQAESSLAKIHSVMSSELSKQYVYLVKQAAVMTPEKFIEIHSREIAENSPLPEAPSLDLAPLRVVAAAQRNQRETGRVSQVFEADKAAIFKELPALSQLFSAAVPSMMTEPQFWERCLKSRYFLSAAGHQVPHAHPEDRLFDSLPMPVKPDLKDKDRGPGHPEADLTGEFERDKLTDKLNQRSSASSANLISRLNERSAGILSQEARSQTEDKLAVHVEKRRAMLRNAAQTFQDDLAAEPGISRAKPQRLQLKPEAGSLLPQKRTEESDRSTLKPLKRQNLTRAPSGGSISESGARWVLKSSLDELLKAERLTETENAKAESAQVAGAMALLQHIWSSRCTEADLRAKLCQEAKRLLNDLEKVEKDKVTSETARSTARSLLPSLRRAVALVETWQPFDQEKRCGEIV